MTACQALSSVCLPGSNNVTYLLISFCYRCQKSAHCPRPSLVPAAPPAHSAGDGRRVCRLPAVREAQGAGAGAAGLGGSTQAGWSLGGESKAEPPAGFPLGTGRLWLFQIATNAEMLDPVQSRFLRALQGVFAGPWSRLALASAPGAEGQFPVELLNSPEPMPGFGAHALAALPLLSRGGQHPLGFVMWIGSRQEPDSSNRIIVIVTAQDACVHTLLLFPRPAHMIGTTCPVVAPCVIHDSPFGCLGLHDKTASQHPVGDAGCVLCDRRGCLSTRL